MDDDRDLEAILASLELPRPVLARWLAGLEAFCRDHGGDRRYRDLLGLLAQCRAREGRGG